MIADDVSAARSLLGDEVVAHVRVRTLAGTPLCFHVLTGSGVLVDTLDDEQARARWQAAPYRHHIYEYRDISFLGSHRASLTPLCHCGHPQGNPVHRPCWEGELQ